MFIELKFLNLNPVDLKKKWSFNSFGEGPHHENIKHKAILTQQEEKMISKYENSISYVR